MNIQQVLQHQQPRIPKMNWMRILKLIQFTAGLQRCCCIAAAGSHDSSPFCRCINLRGVAGSFTFCRLSEVS
jgi:hypothetical protein